MRVIGVADTRIMTGGQMPEADDRRTVKRPLTAERIEQLRARIKAGAYATAAVLQATARAILERRDL